MRTIQWTLVIVSLSVGAFGVALFTELGQLMNLPSAWLYGVHPNLGWLNAVLAAVVLLVLYWHFRNTFLARWQAVSYVVVMAGMIFVTNWFVPEVWLRGHHHTAEYIGVADADGLLEDDDEVFVIEIGDDAAAYPRDWMMLPHIAGDTVGGEEVAMTYCALSNLPQAFSSRVNGREANLKVVSQVHNNLVMVDESSGDLYQQITASTPDARQSLEPRPAQRMPWRSFRELYPDGRVFRVVESGPYAMLDSITFALFENGLESHYHGPDPLFPTLRMDDDRLPPKEPVWGLNLGGEQVAYARSFLERQPVDNGVVGGEPVVVAWFPEYETLGVFSRRLDGRVLEVSEIDVHGNTPAGRLQRLPQYPLVFWMVWSHWYPATRVML